MPYNLFSGEGDEIGPLVNNVTNFNGVFPEC